MLTEELGFPRVVVAGASGFVGMDLIRRLADTHQIIALTRSAAASDAPPDHKNAGVYWVRCNLFSLKESEAALKDSVAAYFLVHSMMPTARLTQGRYSDLDLLIADNFSRACDTNHIRRIIYLGGIQPGQGYNSEHLRSRLEVECALQSRCSQMIGLRAGLVLGPGGSSSQILVKLVKRLPVMICPPWTAKLSSPISLKDTVNALVACLDAGGVQAGIFDLGGPELVTYKSLMKRAADEMCLRRLFIGIPVFSTRLSRLWVSVISGQSKELVAPLIQSLLVDMRPGVSAQLFPMKAEKISLLAALQQAEMPRLSLEITGKVERKELAPPQINQVTSIQRLPRPRDWSANDVMNEYLRWLPLVIRPLIRIHSPQSNTYELQLRVLNKSLLTLQFVPERSDQYRSLMFITGGLLNSAHSGPQGRLEFRVLEKQNIIIAAVLDFTPSLPWYIYKVTQALAHIAVMRLFAWHLKKRCF